MMLSIPGCAEFLPTVVTSPNRLHVNPVDPGLGRYSPGPQGGAEEGRGTLRCLEGSDVERCGYLKPLHNSREVRS